MNCAVTGLIKVCLAYENGLLPGNLHYKEPNPNNESLKAGILKVHPPARPALTPPCCLSTLPGTTCCGLGAACRDCKRESCHVMEHC